ncbi:MAG: hypothetical protein OHK0017_08410 [Patescibacteria group bacterium]
MKNRSEIPSNPVKLINETRVAKPTDQDQLNQFYQQNAEAFQALLDDPEINSPDEYVNRLAIMARGFRRVGESNRNHNTQNAQQKARSEANSRQKLEELETKIKELELLNAQQAQILSTPDELRNRAFAMEMENLKNRVYDFNRMTRVSELTDFMLKSLSKALKYEITQQTNETGRKVWNTDTKTLIVYTIDNSRGEYIDIKHYQILEGAAKYKQEYLMLNFHRDNPAFKESFKLVSEFSYASDTLESYLKPLSYDICAQEIKKVQVKFVNMLKLCGWHNDDTDQK